jgi:uncharacterized protein involved in response to NO
VGAGTAFPSLLSVLSVGAGASGPEYVADAYHLAILIEGLFIPALAISLLVPLYKSRNVRNFIFLFLLGGLFVADMAFMVLQDLRILHVTLLFILMMVSVVGGRIIPAFTVAALRQRGQDVRVTDQKQLDSLCLLSLLGLMLSFISYSEAGAIPAGVAYLAAFLHGLRLRHYHSRRSLVDPLLWILHAGYLWLVVGLFLLGVALGGHLQLSVALHALTVGAIGSLTLGMMCRVALGHTGPGAAVQSCYGSVILADPVGGGGAGIGTAAVAGALSAMD